MKEKKVCKLAADEFPSLNDIWKKKIIITTSNIIYIQLF